MALRRKKKPTSDEASEAEAEAPSILDRLTELRYDITDGESAVARLLDILVDANGGDSAEVLADIESGRQSDGAREDVVAAEGDE